MSGTSNNKVSDMLTDKAKWLASVIRPKLKDSSDDAHSALFHTIREHYAMLSTELLYGLVESMADDDDDAPVGRPGRDL
jgi:hypothetical protein